jgi:hypothetical protein
MQKDAATSLTYEAADMLEICRLFERQYAMRSEDFYARHQAGEFLGIHDAIRWAGYWREYLDLRDSETTIIGKSPDKDLLDAVS